MSPRTRLAAELAKMASMPQSPVTDGNAEQVLDDYLEILEDIPEEILYLAVLAYRAADNPFFPTPGQIRSEAVNLLMSKAGIPQPGEAWSMVLRSPRRAGPRLCDQGSSLRDAIGDDDYTIRMRAYSDHLDTCTECQPQPRDYYDFEHPIVELAVKRLGGYRILMTDNPTADRARFFEAYQNLIDREIRDHTAPPQIKTFITNGAPQIASGIKQITEKWSPA